MKNLVMRGAGIAFVAGMSVSFVHAAYAPGANLYINGGLASSRVFQHNGMACVPVADVAKAINQVVVSKADGYEITPAGGTNQVAGLNGKLGDKLTDGDQTFTVVKAFRTDKYATQFDVGHNVSPDSAGDDVVVVVMRIKNMLNKRVEIYPPHGDNTSLTDQAEHAYKSTYNDCHDSVPKLLPGSACDFALCFSVPKTQKVDTMIFQVFSYGQSKGSTFRVSLASINP